MQYCVCKLLIIKTKNCRLCSVKNNQAIRTMKKLIALSALALAISVNAIAQEHVVVKKEDKVKKTSTLGQKVHNTFSKHKRYNGTKTKHVVKVEKVKDKH